MSRRPLFRKEVIDSRVNRLHGDVIVLPRKVYSWALGMLCCWLIMFATWLATSTFASNETVRGWVEPVGGVIGMYGSGSGNIRRVLVDEGEHVSDGQPLVIVDADRSLISGKTLNNVLTNEYEVQQQLLLNRLERAGSQNKERAEELKRQIAAAEEKLIILSRNRDILKERYQIAVDKLRRYSEMRKAGHVSAIVLAEAQEESLSLNNEIQDRARAEIDQRGELDKLRSEQALLPQHSQDEMDTLRAEVSDLIRRAAELTGEINYAIRATRAGIVSNLLAREGASIQPGKLLLNLVPSDSKLSIQLLVPVKSSGLIQVGQSVDVRYDAFPYQKFGLHRGQVMHISSTALLPSELSDVPIKVSEPVYRVRVELDDADVVVNGRRLSPKSGMSLSADIKVDERTLMRWVLDPIVSLGRAQ